MPRRGEEWERKRKGNRSEERNDGRGRGRDRAKGGGGGCGGGGGGGKEMKQKTKYDKRNFSYLLAQTAKELTPPASKLVLPVNRKLYVMSKY